MKICFLAHNLKPDNGLGVLASHIVAGLQRALGAEVIALTCEKSGLPFEQPILRPHRWQLLKETFRIRSYLKQCDIVHVFDVFPYGIFAMLASIGFRKKFILTLVGTGSILPLYQKINKWFARKALQRADKVVAISRFTKDEILKEVPGIKIEVITPGLDREDFLLAEKEEVSERVRSLRPYILSVGALRPRKGYHLSILAFSYLAKQFPDLNYVIIGRSGSAAYCQTLQGLIEKLGLRGKVRLIDNADSKEELYDFYRGAELFCLFSQNAGHDVEGFGIVFLEAAACGLPVVGTKGCGIEDAALDGRNGILVHEGDVLGLAAAIAKILRDPGLEEKMKEQSLIFSRQSRWQEKVARYANIYRTDLISGGNR